MRFPTEPGYGPTPYDRDPGSSLDDAGNLRVTGDVALSIRVIYEHAEYPVRMRLDPGRDYRLRRAGTFWLVESRPGGNREMAWQREGRLLGEPDRLPDDVPGVTEYHVTAVGSAQPGEWRIRAGFVDKPSGTCDP